MIAWWFALGLVAFFCWAVYEILTCDVVEEIDPWGEVLVVPAGRVPVAVLEEFSVVSVPAEDCIPLDEAWAAGWSTDEVLVLLDEIEAL